MTQIPIVDLERWWGSETDRIAVARAVDAAAREFGFFQIVGHRLPRAHIDAMVAASSEFFALPTDVKQQCTPSDPSVNRGYAASGTEALSYSIGIDTPPDLFEAFNIGEDAVDYADPFYAAQQHGVVRSQHLAGHAGRLSACARRVLRVGTSARPDADRGVRHRAWSSSTVGSRRSSTARPRRCEPSATNVAPARTIRLPGQQRMGAHTDYGIVTVLYAEPVAGLQIVAPDGDWIDVIPADDALVINLGDLTAQWTNDHVAVDRAPGSAAAEWQRLRRAPQRGVLPRRQLGRGDRVPADVRSATNPPRYRTGHRRRSPDRQVDGTAAAAASDAVDTSGDRGR